MRSAAVREAEKALDSALNFINDCDCVLPASQCDHGTNLYRRARALLFTLDAEDQAETCDLCQRPVPDGALAVFCGACEDKLRGALALSGSPVQPEAKTCGWCGPYQSVDDSAPGITLTTKCVKPCPCSCHSEARP